MRVLGVDCGTEITGFGICEQRMSRPIDFICAGGIELAPHGDLPMRLHHIHETLGALIREHRPDVVAVEEVFYSVNAKSALKLGQVRGVALAAAASCGLPLAEYAPLAIKSAVTGYGRAEKIQVQQMVMKLLNLKQLPEPPDAADALAIAICHLHTSATLVRQAAGAQA